MATILITGGTGTLGRHVVARLRDHHLRVLSRHEHPQRDGVRYYAGDLATGQGVAEAVASVDTIVHCAGGRRGDQDLAANLVQAVRHQDGQPHLVCVSVIGADRVPVTGAVDRAMFSYFAMKLATERVVRGSGLPWTIVRASQFYDLVLLVTRTIAKLPVIAVPRGLRFQPVDADDVAQKMVEKALGPPVGIAEDVAGPRVYEFSDLVRTYLSAAEKRRMILPIPLPGRAAHAIKAGALLADGPAAGARTWEDFLTAHAR